MNPPTMKSSFLFHEVGRTTNTNRIRQLISHINGILRVCPWMNIKRFQEVIKVIHIMAASLLYHSNQ